VNPHRLLITTADQRSWRLERPLLFIGSWCLLPDKRERWEGLNAEVLPYHWDDRTKFRADYPYLQQCYEECLGFVANALNAHHGIQHSLRYWRIVLGPWLYLFIHVLFDRWTMVSRAAEHPNVTTTIIINDPENELIPRDLRGMNPDDFRWNHFLYACAIREHGGIQIEELPGESRGVMEHSGTVILPKGVGEWARRVVRLLLDKLVLPGEAFFIHTGLPRSVAARVQWKMCQVPKFWRSEQIPQVEPSLNIRKSWYPHAQGVETDAFKRFLSKMIQRQIPTCYLEGYSELTLAVSALPWPKKPKVIFTSNSFQFDEIFQAWAAQQTERGTPLVIGQHGGFYGVGKLVAGEDHQVTIADRFLTWGWKDARPSIYPLFALTNLNRRQGVGRVDGDLLLVTVPIRMVSFKCSSWPVAANQSEVFLQDQLKFADSLSETVRKRLVLRIHQRSDEKVFAEFIPRWRAAFPNVQIDPSEIPIEGRIIQSRLFVYTYNSTGFLETLGRNIPTVIFWNPEYWELRESALPLFQSLEKVGIFHETPDSAARHVNSIWDNVGKWWTTSSVQNAVQSFVSQYARNVPDPDTLLINALTFPGRGAHARDAMMSD
jgi:putative transferase (TIGR04331 family)